MANVADQIPPGPDWIARRLDDLERQVRELRAARASSATSFKGGAFRLLDADGNPRFAAGQVALDGTIGGATSAYGVLEFADDGAIVHMVQEGYRGLVYPHADIPLHKPDPTQVTSATFVQVVEVTVPFPAHEVVWLEGAVQTPAGTTGELKIVEGFSGQATDVLTIGSDTNGSYNFQWLHPSDVGLYDASSHPVNHLFLGLQARRTGGIGDLTVYPPRIAQLTSRFLLPDAATDGNPSLY
jgi:hypothetical protein